MNVWSREDGHQGSGGLTSVLKGMAAAQCWPAASMGDTVLPDLSILKEKWKLFWGRHFQLFLIAFSANFCVPYSYYGTCFGPQATICNAGGPPYPQFCICGFHWGLKIIKKKDWVCTDFFVIVLLKYSKTIILGIASNAEMIYSIQKGVCRWYTNTTPFWRQHLNVIRFWCPDLIFGTSSLGIPRHKYICMSFCLNYFNSMIPNTKISYLVKTWIYSLTMGYFCLNVCLY